MSRKARTDWRRRSEGVEVSRSILAAPSCRASARRVTVPNLFLSHDRGTTWRSSGGRKLGDELPIKAHKPRRELGFRARARSDEREGVKPARWGYFRQRSEARQRRLRPPPLTHPHTHKSQLSANLSLFLIGRGDGPGGCDTASGSAAGKRGPGPARTARAFLSSMIDSDSHHPKGQSFLLKLQLNISPDFVRLRVFIVGCHQMHLYRGMGIFNCSRLQ